MSPLTYDMVRVMMRERELEATAHRGGVGASAATLRSAARMIARRTRRSR